MPVDSVELECDQDLNHLKLKGFSSSKDSNASFKTRRQVEGKVVSVHCLLWQHGHWVWGWALSSEYT